MGLLSTDAYLVMARVSIGEETPVARNLGTHCAEACEDRRLCVPHALQPRGVCRGAMGHSHKVAEGGQYNRIAAVRDGRWHGPQQLQSRIRGCRRATYSHHYDDRHRMGSTKGHCDV